LSIALAALLIMLTLAIRAHRLDAALICVASTVLCLAGAFVVTWLFGLSHIPRISSDGSTWIRVVWSAKSEVTATSANVIALEERERAAHVDTTDGSFDVDADCSGYEVVVALVRRWLAKRESVA
jgi:hypothetical protein